mgnify:CR=1 FL=1
MNDTFDNLQNQWKEAQKTNGINADSSSMLNTVKRSQKKITNQYIGNILVLLATVIVLTAFFLFVAPMQDLLSRIGIFLMLGGLVTRVIIEWISHQKWQDIDYSQAGKYSVIRAQKFYDYRKKIFGPVTIIIFVGYSIGFYLLTPEFLLYLPKNMVWIMDLSYIPIAAALIYIIRKSYRDESRMLSEMKNLMESFEN